jgi:hypothetical protein
MTPNPQTGATNPWATMNANINQNAAVYPRTPAKDEVFTPAVDNSRPLTQQNLAQYIAQLQGQYNNAGQQYSNAYRNYLPGGVLPAMSMPQGYASAINVTPMSAYQDPYQLAAIGNMENAYANMYGADAAANGQLGSAYYTALGGVQQAQIGAGANRDIAGINAGAMNHASDNTLAGVQDTNNVNRLGINKNYDLGLNTNTTNQNIAGINANAAVDQAYLANVAKYGAMGQLLNGSGNGLGTGLGGGLGTGTGGGGGTTMMDASGGTAGSGAPAVPAFQSFNDIALQRKMGSQAADIAKQYDTQGNNMQQSLAARGFSTKSPGFQAMLAQNNAGKLGAIMDSQRDLSQNAMQYNAQNNLAYGQLGLNQYNADQDRAQRAYLAQLAASRGTLNTLLSS